MFWILFVAAGVVLLVWSAAGWDPASDGVWRIGLYAAAIAAVSGLKLRLPGVFAPISLACVILVSALMELQLAAALWLCVVGMMARNFIRPAPRPGWYSAVFGVLTAPIGLFGAHLVLQSSLLIQFDGTLSVAVVLASATYFVANTWIVATMNALVSGASCYLVWRRDLSRTVWQYLAGGAIAGGLHLARGLAHWQTLILVLPPSILLYRSYTQYLKRIDEQQGHIVQMAKLHWRTIEALALAIEAKDETTASHLKRVQVYAVELARELGLSPAEVTAVEVASLLHDIGKLAVPEYIISKPGLLTPEEFDKMKIHPVVGAEILERVNFPYPVVPIVRSHHEKFDGTGYPDGLKGAEIPIGARILSAVDCLDALASPRQYRAALPMQEAMDMVEKAAGTSFDPSIVEVLRRRHKELEAMTRAGGSEHSGMLPGTDHPFNDPELATDDVEGSPVARENSFTVAIANARREVQLLVEITNDLGNSLRLDETLALLALRLGKMVPHDAVVIYLVEGGFLVPQYVQGESYRLFSSLRIPVGQGLSGWVAENDAPILNGHPAVEPGYLKDRQKITNLRSAISVPLNGRDGVVAVLTLYHLAPEAFDQDHLRVLLAIRSKAGLAIENSIRYSRVAFAAEKDELTGLLNAGSLSRLLEQAIRESSARQGMLSVIVLDLDGFKQANDEYGHLAGNRVLQEIALGLTDCCRRSDYVARLGGDEFVLVLRDADPQNLTGILSRIQHLGPEAGMKACGARFISISSGVAMFPQDGRDAESLLETADLRMYEAKKESKTRRAGLRLAEVVAGIRPIDSPPRVQPVESLLSLATRD